MNINCGKWIYLRSKQKMNIGYGATKNLCTTFPFSPQKKQKEFLQPLYITFASESFQRVA